MSRSSKHKHPPPSSKKAKVNGHSLRERHGDEGTGEFEASGKLSGVLVLNHNFEPLNICSIQRGMALLMLEKAEVCA
jgi:hypothetical protein